MNIHHLKYFIALAKRRNYREAANFCNVSQPAISLAIKNFEEKLGKTLFLRQKSPIELSPFGHEILQNAERIVFEYESMMNLAQEEAQSFDAFRLGIIPTVAPYLLPKFLPTFTKKFPNMPLSIEELTTEALIKKINQDELDGGIIATPVEGMKLEAQPLYYEEFFAYTNGVADKEYILPKDIALEKLWLLQEGHCLRSQVINLCEIQAAQDNNIQYQAGSIETLINLVDTSGGITIIPELASQKLTGKRKQNIKLFAAPTPVREISMVYHRYSVKKNNIKILANSVLASIPKYMKEKENVLTIGI